MNSRFSVSLTRYFGSLVVISGHILSSLLNDIYVFSIKVNNKVDGEVDKEKVKDINRKKGEIFYLNLKMLEEEKPTQIIVRILVFGLHQVMLTRLRRHQGLVLDHCKNEHRHKYRNT